MGKFEKKYRKVAYGYPKDKKGAGTVLNVGSRVGTRIVQFVYLRPQSFGYRVGRGKTR